MLHFRIALIYLLWSIHGDPVGAAGGGIATPRLYIADQGFPFVQTGRILGMTTEGTDLQTILSGLTNAPDGIVVDKDAGYIYFSQMGSALFPDSVNGTIERVRLDGTGRSILVDGGATHTPKQLIMAEISGQKKLYWGDREGMRVMRSDPDGSQVETVVDTSHSGTGSAESKMAVGVAVDPINGWLYWTQKGGEQSPEGSLHRLRLNASLSQSANTLLMQGLAEPIDLHYRASTQTLYWTQLDGNVRSLFVGTGREMTGAAQLVAQGVGKAIGINVDEDQETLLFDNLAGEVYSCRLDGSSRIIIKDGLGLLTGIALA